MADEHVTLKKSTYNKILLSVVVLLVAVSFSAGFMIGGSGSGTTVQQTGAVAGNNQPSQPTAPTDGGRVQVSADDDPVLGNPNAPITIIEFSDFQCPFCERFYTQSEKQMIAEYVNTGKAKLVYRDFPLDSIHPQAVPGALAADCANEQGKFWEYHNKIFENQDLMGDARYKQWAVDLGLNAGQFNSCYDSQKYLAEIDKDTQDGLAAGVSGTPTVFVGNQQDGYVKIVGAQPYSAFKAAIDAELV